MNAGKREYNEVMKLMLECLMCESGLVVRRVFYTLPSVYRYVQNSVICVTGDNNSHQTHAQLHHRFILSSIEVIKRQFHLLKKTFISAACSCEGQRLLKIRSLIFKVIQILFAVSHLTQLELQ